MSEVISNDHRSAHWQHLLLVGLIAVIGSYFYIGEFGFYEDDYNFVVPYLHADSEDIYYQVEFAFEYWPQGRPLNHTLPSIFGWLGYQAGHIWGIYLLCVVVIVANALLVYRLIRWILGSVPAVAGAAFFTLYPADTTRSFIVHVAHLQTGLTLCLCGMLLFRSGGWKRLLAYPVAGASLLAYETTFLPFVVGVPLLVLIDASRRPRWPLLWKHVLGCAIVLCAVASIRFALSEPRAIEALADVTETLWRSASSLWIGPVASLTTVVLAVRNMSLPGTGWEALAVASCALGLFIVLTPGAEHKSDYRHLTSGEGCAQTSLLVGFGGVIMWIGSYALSIIHYPPNFLAGRLTSVHMAGAVGAAVAFAAVAAAVFSRSNRPRTRAVTAAALCAFFACLIANGLAIQRDYAAAWTMQRTFWTEVLGMVPDLQINDVVVLAGDRPAQPEAILANSWADTSVFPQLVEFGQFGQVFDTSLFTPTLFWLDRNLVPAADAFRRDGDVLLMRPRGWLPDEQVYVPENTIVLRRGSDGWERLSQFELPSGEIIRGRLNEDGDRTPVQLSAFGELLLGVPGP